MPLGTTTPLEVVQSLGFFGSGVRCAFGGFDVPSVLLGSTVRATPEPLAPVLPELPAATSTVPTAGDFGGFNVSSVLLESTVRATPEPFVPTLPELPPETSAEPTPVV